MVMNIVKNTLVEQVVEKAARNLGYFLKEEQRRVINAFIHGEDVFAVLLTGFGKSLCYGCLPFAFDKIRDDGLLSVVIVVTPLTAIMKDQVLDTLFALVLLLFSCTLDHLRQPATPRQPHPPRQKLLPYWS